MSVQMSDVRDMFSPPSSSGNAKHEPINGPLTAPGSLTCAVTEVRVHGWFRRPYAVFIVEPNGMPAVLWGHRVFKEAN